MLPNLVGWSAAADFPIPVGIVGAAAYFPIPAGIVGAAADFSILAGMAAAGIGLPGASGGWAVVSVLPSAGWIDLLLVPAAFVEEEHGRSCTCPGCGSDTCLRSYKLVPCLV